MVGTVEATAKALTSGGAEDVATTVTRRRPITRLRSWPMKTVAPTRRAAATARLPARGALLWAGAWGLWLSQIRASLAVTRPGWAARLIACPVADAVLPLWLQLGRR